MSLNLRQVLLLSIWALMAILPSVSVAQFSCEAAVAILEPLNDWSQYDKANLSGGWSIPGKRMHHIFHGDFSTVSMRRDSKTTAEIALDEGMHTYEAFKSFMEKRNDLFGFLTEHEGALTESSNGVIGALLPISAFSNPRNRGWKKLPDGSVGIRKTIFPKSWKKHDVLAAIDTVVNTGTSDRPITDPTQPVVLKQTYRGVLVYVVVIPKWRTILTAYPAPPSLQPQ